MVRVKRNDGLPANFDELPADMKWQIEEDVYRRQLKWSHGYSPGDPRLTSLGRDGIPASSSFGKKVDLNKMDDEARDSCDPDLSEDEEDDVADAA